MSSILFLIFVIMLLRNPKDRRNSDLVKYLIGGSVILGLIGIALPIFPIAILGIIGYIIYLLTKKNNYNEKAKQYGFNQKDYRGRPVDARFREDAPHPGAPHKTMQNQGYSYNGTAGSYNGTSYQNQNGNSQWTSYNTSQTGAPNGAQRGNGAPYGGAPYGAGAQRGAGAPYGAGAQRGAGAPYGAGAQNGRPGGTGYRGDSVYGGTTLPASASKRRKIIAKFNDKYKLYLTDAQIQSMVNSSYVSQTWRREIEAMDRKYENMYEWFQGPTSWLRVYMYVFKVQEICSDIALQENIVAHSFDEIFDYADECQTFSIHDTIDRVNNHFLTSFDDATFAMAYRFLEKKGRKHVIKTHRVVKTENTVDDLEAKYSKV